MQPPVRQVAPGQRDDDEDVADDGEPGPSGAHMSWAAPAGRQACHCHYNGVHLSTSYMAVGIPRRQRML